jgi:hypothetical protein
VTAQLAIDERFCGLSALLMRDIHGTHFALGKLSLQPAHGSRDADAHLIANLA